MTDSKLDAIPAHQANLTFGFNNPVNGNSAILEMGKIRLNVGNSKLLFQATSGLPGFQNLGSSKQKGKGRIPSCLQAKITSYFVKTKPVFLPNTKGVNGNFYPIIPFAVKVDGYQRSDLGIHADRNVPGSAGCIVITIENHWNFFQKEMAELAKQGILELPLLVF